MALRKLVVITGCDSGLGFSLSKHCKRLGMSVVSGCLDQKSEGARKLLESDIQVLPLDVTKPEDVQAFGKKIGDLTTTGEYELHALVNNAGVMVFGEFEWLTDHQIERQIEVNQIGTLRVAKTLLPLLRKHRGRLINVTSHCGLSALPGITVYSSTKAAIENWSEGLRLEQAKYGVHVSTFIPGSLPDQTRIMGNQKIYAEEQLRALQMENRTFPAKYFQEFHSYFTIFAGEQNVKEINDQMVYRKFSQALLDVCPKPVYKCEPWRYFLYYNAIKIVPYRFKDFLVQKFMKLPQYESNNL